MSAARCIQTRRLLALSASRFSIASCSSAASVLVFESAAECCITAEEQEEVGWKYLHGDIFRPPPYLGCFAAAIGTGTQVLVMAVFVFALALVGVFYPYNRGALLVAFVVCSPFCADTS